MHIDSASKVIFIHNPKTGGRSIVKALGLVDDLRLKLVHFGTSDARRCIFQNTWDEFFSFCFVRNPWDRMVSLYEYQRSVGYGAFQKLNHSHNLARNYNFDEWLEINSKISRKANWFGVPQSFWSEGVTKVYLFEDFSQSCTDIASRIGGSFQGVHENASLRRDYHDYYKDKRSIETVRRIELATISNYNYRF